MAILASLVATAVGARFCVALASRWQAGGRTNEALLHWALSTGMFALASLMLLASEVVGWSPAAFRVFYVFGAVLNVPWLALGSTQINLRSRGVTRTTAAFALATGLLFLPPALAGEDLALSGAILGIAWGVLALLPQPSARRGLLVLLLGFAVIGLVAVATATLQEPLPADGIPEGRELFVPWVRGLAVGGNALGAVVVIVGAVASAVAMAVGNTTAEHRAAFRRRLRRAPVEAVATLLYEGIAAARAAGVANLAGGNLLIALGVLIAAGSGGMFSFLGDTTGHAIGLGGGATVMYLGFTRTLGRPAAVPGVAA